MWRSEDEVDEQMNKASEGIDAGSAYPGMSYEEGVHQALGWVTGQYPDPL